jgi:hypothetical protein
MDRVHLKVGGIFSYRPSQFQLMECSDRTRVKLLIIKDREELMAEHGV